MKQIDVDVTRLPIILEITPVALPSLEIQPQNKAFLGQASGKYLFHPVAPFFWKLINSSVTRFMRLQCP